MSRLNKLNTLLADIAIQATKEGKEPAKTEEWKHGKDFIVEQCYYGMVPKTENTEEYR